MAEPDGVDGRHKAGHDGGGRSINSYRDKSQIRHRQPALRKAALRASALTIPSEQMIR